MAAAAQAALGARGRGETDGGREADSRGRDRSRSPAAHLLDALPWLPEIGGTVEVMANPATLGAPDSDGRTTRCAPASASLRLKGRLADSARWSVNGLVTENESTTWRMTADFVVEPRHGHRITPAPATARAS